MRWLVFALVVLGLSFASTARAGDSGSNKAAAEALFSEGRSLMAKGRYAEAIPKFQASQKLDPGGGTLLNLAECYERTGKTASAWAEYREVVSMARASGASEREELAQQKARDLEPKLSRLAISLASGANITGLEVKRDGELVEPGELGVAIPVDPGRHVVEAAAPGKQTWSATIEVGSAANSERVEIPVLLDAAAAGAATPPPGEQPPAPKKSGSTQRTLALVVGGVGVAGIVVGSIFGLQATSSWDDAKNACKDFPYDCGEDGVSAADDAETQAMIATIGFVAGGVCLAGAAVLWFTAGSGQEQKVAVGLGPNGLRVKGTF